MGSNSIFRLLLVPLIAIAAGMGSGCDSESITEIDSTDTLRVEIKKGNGSYSTFHVRLSTAASYGCNAQIAYRFSTNKSRETVFDVIGVEPGEGQCDKGATTGLESIEYTTRREFLLEIRNKKKVTRYRIFRNGSQWSDSLLISDIPSNIHFIEENVGSSE